MFLSREDLKSMTGAKRPKEIIAWLREHAAGRWKLGLDGWPVVHEEVARELFGVGAGSRGRRRGSLRLDHLKGNDGQATKASAGSP